LRPAWANCSQDSISKITKVKWTGGVAQAIECLLCKCEALSSNSIQTQPPPKQTNKQNQYFKSVMKGVKDYLFLVAHTEGNH
jgi:hypothetical protein